MRRSSLGTGLLWSTHRPRRCTEHCTSAMNTIATTAIFGHPIINGYIGKYNFLVLLSSNLYKKIAQMIYFCVVYWLVVKTESFPTAFGSILTTEIGAQNFRLKSCKTGKFRFDRWLFVWGRHSESWFTKEFSYKKSNLVPPPTLKTLYRKTDSEQCQWWKFYCAKKLARKARSLP